MDVILDVKMLQPPLYFSRLHAVIQSTTAPDTRGK